MIWTRDSEIDPHYLQEMQYVIDEANGECTVLKSEFVEDALADPDGRPTLGPAFGWDQSYDD